jgi:hypothetical protein
LPGGSRGEVAAAHECVGSQGTGRRDREADEADLVEAVDERLVGGRPRAARAAGGTWRRVRRILPTATAPAIWGARPVAGLPASIGRRVARIVCWKIAPRVAMPVAIPSWRAVLLAADAIPLRAGGATAASAGVVSPMPRPARICPGSSAVQPKVTVSLCIRNRPTEIRVSPVPIASRGGIRVVSRPEAGATKSSSPVTGTWRRPAN